jgi:hypothetical protein
VLHAALIGPACGDCHATGTGAGGLGGLESCALGYAAMVGVASTQLPTMPLVQPGDPTMSWLTYKLDGTQNVFDAQCVGGSCGGNMPLNRPRLLAEERAAISAWITAGAVNDCVP